MLLSSRLNFIKNNLINNINNGTFGFSTFKDEFFKYFDPPKFTDDDKNAPFLLTPKKNSVTVSIRHHDNSFLLPFVSAFYYWLSQLSVDNNWFISNISSPELSSFDGVNFKYSFSFSFTDYLPPSTLYVRQINSSWSSIPNIIKLDADKIFRNKHLVALDGSTIFNSIPPKWLVNISFAYNIDLTPFFLSDIFYVKFLYSHFTSSHLEMSCFVKELRGSSLSLEEV